MTKISVRIGLAITLLAAAVILAPTAGVGDRPPMGGMVPLNGNSVGPTPVQGLSGGPFKIYGNAFYATGGVALRNRTTGVIHISGVGGPIQDAWLYWVFLFISPPTASQPITINRIFPGFASATIKGQRIATTSDPCWGSQGAAIYRARVPLAVATGNGLYQVFLSPAASASSSGKDPWAAPIVFPAAEGASLVVVGAGNATVSIYDFLATSFAGAYNYTLLLPAPFAPNHFAIMDSFGGDGQTGFGRQDLNFAGTETTKVNGFAISGSPASLDPDSDWNGSSGFPLPQLWNDSGHDISVAVSAPGVTQLDVAIAASGDCLVPVGNVVAAR